MMRRLVTFAAVASAVLWAAVVVLWVRSYRVQYWILAGVAGHQIGTTRYGDPTGGAATHRGGLYLFVLPLSASDRSRRWGSDLISPTPAYVFDQPDVRVAGFSYAAGRNAWGGWFVGAPLPAVATAAALPALGWVRSRYRHRRRRRAGLCPACGYDLRVTPGRCPECGAETR